MLKWKNQRTVQRAYNNYLFVCLFPQTKPKQNESIERCRQEQKWKAYSQML